MNAVCCWVGGWSGMCWRDTLDREAGGGRKCRGDARPGSCFAGPGGTIRDENEAIVWFRKAAEVGIPDAMDLLGECFSAGEGVIPNREEAVGWYRKGAECGYPSAMVHLADCLVWGRGVSRNRSAAMLWLERAAAGGDSEAMFQLAVHLARRHSQEAIRWLELAAERRHTEAMYYMQELGSEMAVAPCGQRERGHVWALCAARGISAGA
jgi:TPR repeat protein